MKSFQPILLACLMLAGMFQIETASAKKPSTSRKAKAKASRSISSESSLTPQQESALKERIALKPKDFDSRIRLADHYMARKDYSRVVEILRPVSEKLPRQGLLLLAKAYGAQNHYLNEIRVLEILLSQNSQDYFVQYSLAKSYAGAGKDEEAILNFKGATEINIRFEPAYDGLLDLYKKTGNTYEARILIGDMVKLFGEKPAYQNELCRLYSEEGYIEKAIEVCRHAIAIDRNHPDNHVHLGLSMRDKENVDQAAKILKQTAKQFPSSEIAQWAAGKLSAEEKNLTAAFKFYKQGTEVDPASRRCQLGLASTAFELQKFDDSLKAYIAACRIDPTITPEIRKSAAILRQKKEREWSTRFEAGIAKCRN